MTGRKFTEEENRILDEALRTDKRDDGGKRNKKSKLTSSSMRQTKQRLSSIPATAGPGQK
jgi:hypothetical protein